MFCLDVKALCPSVLRNETRNACRIALDKRTNPKLPTEDTLKLIDTVLENNIFSFNDNTYVQTEGTAIGSRLGMSYACTYMGEWEAELFKRTKYQSLHYWRFVDDVWGLWTHGQEDLVQLVNLANNIHPIIQAELRYSQDSIEFLYFRTTLNNGRIHTDLYTKDTDKHQYSAHHFFRDACAKSG